MLSRYITYSFLTHALLFLGFVGTAYWKNRNPQTVYTIDLMSSLPAGSMGGSAGALPMEKEAPRVAPPVPKETPKEALKVADKKKKTPAKTKEEPRQVYKLSPTAQKNTATEGDAGSGKGASGAGSGGGGSGIIASAGEGTPFPFPWYLKQVVDRLEQHWQPDINLDCQVTFTIQRNGQVSDPKISKSSGDSGFDQLALRAVEYANPFPPLPPAFPNETLRVHMKLKGN